MHADRMRLLVLCSVFALATSVGCVVPMTPVEPGREYRLHLAADLSPEEREDAAQALADWRAFSGGRLAVVVTDGPGDVDLVHGPLGFSRIGGEIRIPAHQPDRRAMLTNIVGQFAGMRMHEEDGVLCRLGVGPELTEADRAACREAGLCE